MPHPPHPQVLLSRRTAMGLVAAAGIAAPALTAQAQAGALPSWNDGPSRSRILDFVARVCRTGGPDYVPPEERIAVFDNDGTLWSEKPAYVQADFLFERIHVLSAQHPEWKHEQPYAAVLSGDMQALTASGEPGLVKLVMATHAGMTTATFDRLVVEWLAKARDTRFKRPYTELVFQPMLELLGYLRANDFQTWIVSGGGVEFMRPWTERVYGIPRNQVVGSTIKTQLEIRNGKPALMRLAQIEFIDDGPGKPVGINRAIGRRPIFAAGNSDGDLQMLQWTTAGSGARFGMIVHHTDARREWAYDRKSSVGRLDKALDLASHADWAVVDMRTEWRRIYPFES